MARDRNIFNWFGRREEKEIFEKAESHIEKVCETVMALHDAARSLFAGKEKEAKEHILTIRKREHEADEIRRQMFDDLSVGMLMPADREDLTHMIEAMDDIADWANDAGKLLSVIDEKIPAEIAKKLEELIEKTLSCVMKAKEAVIAMRSDVKKALALCNEVEFLEEECDDIEKGVFTTTLHNRKLSPPMLLLLHDVIASVETVSDKAEDTADIIRVLVVKQK